MYIERVPNRNSPPAVLLRESYREGNKVRKRTLANLSKLPDEVVDNMRLVLKGALAVEPQKITNIWEIIRSLPHGHVAAVLGTLKKIGLSQIIAKEKSRKRDLIIAMIVSRIINPTSKLATVRGINRATASSSLGKILNLEKADSDECYEALDWLISKPEEIENQLAKKHLTEGSLILYDLTSTYFEGAHCSLAKSGYNRDKKKGKLQIVFGLLCARQGCPIAVEVFEGNTLDSQTLSKQIEKVRARFGIKQVVWVGDPPRRIRVAARGIITSKNIREELEKIDGLQWITALSKHQIRKLIPQESFQLGLFDQKNLVEIESEDYPGERLVVCRNPLVAEKNSRTREELITATEELLKPIIASTKREKRPLKGAEKIGVRVGKVINKFKVGKYFELNITDESFEYSLKTELIAEEKSLDGVYIIRSNVPDDQMNSVETVQTYKSLSVVEQAFRSYKTIDLKVRPIYHYKDSRVKAHIFLCLLAYYVEWHMRKLLAPLLFDDLDYLKPVTTSESIVTSSHPSVMAIKKANTKRNEDNLVVHSFPTLLDDLATITSNKVQFKLNDSNLIFEKITQPTVLQQKAFDLLGVSVFCTQ